MKNVFCSFNASVMVLSVSDLLGLMWFFVLFLLFVLILGFGFFGY